MMFPAMNGAVALSTLPEVALDASPGDIFSNLQIGLMLYLEARTNKWAISSDLIYMDLSQDVKQGNVIIGDIATLDVKDSYLHASQKKVIALGIQDCIIIETGNTVLVVHKDYCQEVKKFAEK